MSTNDIPPAVTLYWQEQRIKELEARNLWQATELQHMQTVLAACQKALKEMQAQRDKAREGKR